MRQEDFLLTPTAFAIDTVTVTRSYLSHLLGSEEDTLPDCRLCTRGAPLMGAPRALNATGPAWRILNARQSKAPTSIGGRRATNLNHFGGAKTC